MTPKCNSQLVIPDYYGNSAYAFECDKEEDHIGSHEDKGELFDKAYYIAWDKNKEE